MLQSYWVFPVRMLITPIERTNSSSFFICLIDLISKYKKRSRDFTISAQVFVFIIRLALVDVVAIGLKETGREVESLTTAEVDRAGSVHRRNPKSLRQGKDVAELDITLNY